MSEIIIAFVPWPTPGFDMFLTNEDKMRCLFCVRRAVHAAYYRSPHNFTIANRCCVSEDCMKSAVSLTRAFVDFDSEVNHRVRTLSDVVMDTVRTMNPMECVCRTPGCGHLASAHRGEVGACVKPGCKCGPGGWS